MGVRSPFRPSSALSDPGLYCGRIGLWSTRLAVEETWVVCMFYSCVSMFHTCSMHLPCMSHSIRGRMDQVVPPAVVSSPSLAAVQGCQAWAARPHTAKEISATLASSSKHLHVASVLAQHDKCRPETDIRLKDFYADFQRLHVAFRAFRGVHPQPRMWPSTAREALPGKASLPLSRVLSGAVQQCYRAGRGPTP